MSKKKKYYVVWVGKTPGIYEDWNSCKRQVEGFEKPVYKSFTTKEEAELAYRSDPKEYIGKIKTNKVLSDEVISKYGKPSLDSLCVDAACSGSPGKMEYRGVDYKTGAEFFRVGPFPLATNNIGEFLAIVHGLAFLKERDLEWPIYTDSRTAMSWLRNMKIKTKLPRNNQTEKVFHLMDRAMNWLKNNEYKNPILKWETKVWGEIPADFGRK